MSAAEIPPPRERRDLFGQEAAEAAFAEAIRFGRLPHAWLIGGPPGIGKATLAFRVARHLLATPGERATDGSLAVDPGGRTFRQVAAGSHPNLVTLDVQAGEGKPASKTVPVEAVRRALGFFGTTAADGGHRVCIIDSVEDLTLAGANALLKTVEEPPARATILIVSHAPARTLATIRSRCRKLACSRLGAGDLGRVLSSLDLDPSDPLAIRAMAVAEGSVRRTLELMDPKRLAVLDDVTALLAALPDPPMKRVLALADRVADRRGEDDFPLALETILTWAGERLREQAGMGPARLAPLADVCEKLAEAARAVETYNLDRRPFILSLFGDLADAVRAGG